MNEPDPPTAAEQLVVGIVDAVDAFNRGEPIVTSPSGRVILHQGHAFHPTCHVCGRPSCTKPTPETTNGEEP